MVRIYPDGDAAVADIQDNATIMSGGFGLCGIPENSIKALVKRNIKNLTIISNNAGVNGHGVGLLLEQKMIKKIIGSYVGENTLFEQQLLAGLIDVELIPQGTLATRIQMAAMGIPAFFCLAGYGTEIAIGKEVRTFNGKSYLMEHALHADFSLVKAWRGDTAGNLVFKKTTRNFSVAMAKAAQVTIAEVEELVEAGAIDPDTVDVPGIYVSRIYQGKDYEKKIENLKIRQQNQVV